MRILIVDDDSLVRDSLKTIFGADRLFDVVGLAENGDEAIRQNRALNPDIILMDIRMPETDGIEATMRIKEESPQTKIIMLTTFKDFKNIHQSLHAGANGYLIKSDDFEKQKSTIKAVYEGYSIISEEALQSLSGKNQDEALSPRENDVLELVANGYTNKEIAKRLYIGEGTVRNTLSVILDKLALRDRTQLAIYYWQTKKTRDDENL